MHKMYFIVYLILLAYSQSVLATQYHIYPTITDQCPPGEIPCRNLSYVATNLNDYFLDDSVTNFIEGTHYLTGSKMIEIYEKHNLVLQGPINGVAHVKCDPGGGGFVFFGITNLTIKSLVFTGCGKVTPSNIMSDTILNYTKTKFVNFMFLQSFHCILVANVSDLSIDKLTIHNTTGRAISLVNVFNIDISDVDLSYNNVQSLVNPYCTITNCTGGNIYFLYVDDKICWQGDNTIFNLTVKNSIISRGVSERNILANGGLGVGIYHTVGYGINIIIDNVTFDGNTGLNGANVFVSIPEDYLYYSVTFNNIASVNGNAIYPFLSKSRLRETEGAGIFINTGTFFASFATCPGGRVGSFNEGNQIAIINAVLSGNIAEVGAGAMIAGKSCLQGDSCSITIENTTVFENKGSTGTGLFLRQFKSITSRVQLSGLLKNVHIYNNDVESLVSDENQPYEKCAVYITEFEYLSLSGVSVKNHGNSGIYLYKSDITIEDQNTTIENNTNPDSNGGGMVFVIYSHVTLVPPGSLVFINNHATLGGGIYVDIPIIAEEKSPTCFFQIHDVDSYSQNVIPEAHIFAFNNTASVAGDILYATDGGLFHCVITTLSYYYGSTGDDLMNNFLNKMLVIDQNSDVIESALRSTPVKLCVCESNGMVNCSNREKTVEIIPGKTVYFTVVTVDFTDLISPGAIRVTYFNASDDDRVTSHDLIYTVSNDCITTHHSVTNMMYTSSQLTAVDSTNEVDNTPITIHFSFLDCPPGFSLNNGICDCNEIIRVSSLNITCSTDDWSITRVGNNWINYHQNCTQIYVGCPFDYCNGSSVTFNIMESQSQCQFNRQGTLCGQCKDGYSLLLGSNECSKCTDFSIFLLVPFCVAGFLLVVVLIVLNLTVAEGTINGLIFYANIVKISESVFFQRKSFPVLTQFISWINLDLGIPTCLYNGLDVYVKTWLQFAFPVYIWCIIIIIVYLAHRFSKISRLVGNNPVAVLATLLLLSYTKILRTIILTMQRGVIQCDDGTEDNVWLLDGSIRYFSFKHVILFLFSLAVLIFICIPFTAFHLFIPVLERCVFNRQRFSKIYVIIRPYLDVVGGPYKDEYRFWPGLLLLIRLALASIIPFVDTKYDNIAIITSVILIFLLGWNLQGVYRKWYNNVIESWFLFNLGLLCVLSFSDIPIEGAIVLLSLAFTSFLAILIFHIAKRCYKKKSGKNSNQENPLQEENDEQTLPMQQRAYAKISKLGMFNPSRQTPYHSTVKRNESKELFINVESSVKCRRETLITN